MKEFLLCYAGLFTAFIALVLWFESHSPYWDSQKEREEKDQERKKKHDQQIADSARAYLDMKLDEARERRATKDKEAAARKHHLKYVLDEGEL